MIRDDVLRVDEPSTAARELDREVALLAAEAEPGIEAVRLEEGVPEDDGAAGDEAEDGRAREAVARQRAPGHPLAGRVDGAAVRDDEDPRGHERELRVVLQQPRRPGEGARGPPGVVVGEGDDRRPRALDAEVPRGAGEVLARLEDLELREAAARRGRRPVARAVVDDEDWGPLRQRPQAVERAQERVPPVTCCDDDAHLHGRSGFARLGPLGVELRLPRLAEPPPTPRAEGAPGCHWPFESAYVTHGGKVQPCCMVMGADRVVLGDLEQETFATVWTGEAYRRFREGLLDGAQPPTVCRGCSLYRRVF